ncbi:methyltransferase family protein [Kutzneria buriramensis]|uniref:Methyltransferase family protein n=2 Tax=Kutzneria buriramensis TaxID=1045776 RepID=A0A3E0HQL2_9PSEU|nr:methyltransferase family protein [Kutzneria buriramensis]
MSIRATAGDTDGALSVVEQRAVRGYSTPPHVHSREDETLVVLAGELSYLVDGREGVLRAGESAFLPRHKPHRFAVISEEAHFLVLITPGGFEEMFQIVSSPAAENRLPGGDAHAHTDPAVMAAESAARGTTVFRDDPVERSRHLANLASGHAVLDSYRRLGELIAGPGPTPDDVVDGLVVAAKRIPEDPAHARALILLGVLSTSCHDAVTARLPEILAVVGSPNAEPVTLALDYLEAQLRGDDSAAALGTKADNVVEPGENSVLAPEVEDDYLRTHLTAADVPLLDLATGRWTQTLVDHVGQVLTLDGVDSPPGVLPFATGSLGAVNCSHALELLPSPREVLREVARCLRPGGVFTAVTARRSDRPTARFFQRQYEEASGVRSFTPTELTTWLGAAGLDLVDLRSPAGMLLLTARRSA